MPKAKPPAPRRLVLLRHAKAAAKDAAKDFERKLAGRGRRQMEAVARYLAGPEGAALRPDLALVSPAARTRETWERSGLAGVPVRFDERLYEATPETLLAVLAGAEASARTVLLVGHNPSIETVAARLSADPALADGFPTASLAAIDLEGDDWSSPRGGRLERFVKPDDLGVGR